MRKRARDAGRTAPTLQERVDAILAQADEAAHSRLCTAAGLDWGGVKDDFFDVLRPFVQTLDPDSTESELFSESESKDDATVLEESNFLVRQFAISEDEGTAMKEAAPADRRRMLFVHLLVDANEEVLGEGEEGEAGEAGEEEEVNEDAPALRATRSRSKRASETRSLADSHAGSIL